MSRHFRNGVYVIDKDNELRPGFDYSRLNDAQIITCCERDYVTTQKLGVDYQIYFDDISPLIYIF